MLCSESPVKSQQSFALLEHEILNTLTCGLVVLNARGTVIWVNAAAKNFLGNDLLGSVWLSVIARAFSPREDDGHEISLVDGRRVNVSVSSLDSIPGSLITLIDMTASREYEHSKAHQGRLAAIGNMTAQLAHQIRTPLASATLYCDHLTNRLAHDSRSQQWLNRIQESHRSIEHQIQDLLLFARGEAIELAMVDLPSWSRDLENRVRMIEDGAAVKIMIDNQLPSINYYLHQESLAGAVLNLVNNALQAGAENIFLMMKPDGEQAFFICVQDDGPGMTEEVKAQAFAPFYTTKAQGTGLGLAVVQAVVKAHGGYTDLVSSPGQGCCITIHLP
ncbi:sensor histidine kinase [Legionella dresdenensis]|uniref:histidine kinase n=1 Tax=Legionella dresdenensis TaxID=450200 RepID=A0ABV8CCG9_9GAMM